MENIEEIDMLVYSSHKTSTQSILNTLKNNNYKVLHIHTIKHLISNYIDNVEYTNNVLYENTLNKLNKRKKKLKIITCLRNPKERLLSSFFQTYYNDHITYLNIKPENTIINTKNLKELHDFYIENISNLPNESLFEIFDLFNINYNDIIYKSYYYFYENDLIELYIIKYDNVIKNTNYYLSYVLNINLNIHKIIKSNISELKPYYIKYVNLKKKIQNNTVINKYIYIKYKDIYDIYNNILTL